jgi:hypothetical protein
MESPRNRRAVAATLAFGVALLIAGAVRVLGQTSGSCRNVGASTLLGQLAYSPKGAACSGYLLVPVDQDIFREHGPINVVRDVGIQLVSAETTGSTNIGAQTLLRLSWATNLPRDTRLSISGRGEPSSELLELVRRGLPLIPRSARVTYQLDGVVPADDQMVVVSDFQVPPGSRLFALAWASVASGVAFIPVTFGDVGDSRGAYSFWFLDRRRTTLSGALRAEILKDGVVVQARIPVDRTRYSSTQSLLRAQVRIELPGLHSIRIVTPEGVAVDFPFYAFSPSLESRARTLEEAAQAKAQEERELARLAAERVATSQALRAMAIRVSNDFEASFRRVEIYSCARGEDCYDRTALEKLSDQARQAAIDGVRVAALKDYIGASWPNITTLSPPQRQAGAEVSRPRFAASRGSSFQTPTSISGRDGKKFRDSVTSFLSKLGRLASDLVVDLRVESSPAGAELKLYPRSRPQDELRAVANSTISNVYRGLYVYQVSWLGAQFPVTPGPLNLVDSRERRLLCSLSENDSRPLCRFIQ